VPAEWTHWGHMSLENLPEISIDGGDTTTYGTWLRRNTGSKTEEGTIQQVFNFNQRDSVTLAAANALDGTESAYFLLSQSGQVRNGEWAPRAKWALTKLPTRSTDGYSEWSLTATILKPAASVNLDSIAGSVSGAAVVKGSLVYFDNDAFASA